MVNQTHKKVVRHLKMGQLNKIIKKKKKELEIIDRHIFIRFLYKCKTVDETCEFMGISLSIGHRWLNRWNDEECDGLFNRYSNDGRKSKLTED
jgi:transposase